MGALFLAALALLAIFLALAVFARGGATETIHTPGLAPEHSGLAKLSLEELASVTARLFNELGFATESQSAQPRHIDLRLRDPTPVTGQSIYVRCLLMPEAGAVESAEVQAALDTARHESLSKAVVVTPGTFSDEARLVAQGAALELIDGASLAALLRTHLPDVANRLALPR